jgi:micrococcal nuclease
MRNKKDLYLQIVVWVGAALLVAGLILSLYFLYQNFLVKHGPWSRNNRGFSRTGKYAELIQPGTAYRVVDVIDGDTMIADIQGHEVTLRLIGIDTPEVVDHRKPVQCYGSEASAEGKRLLNQQFITIQKDPLKPDYDLYGRVLAYVTQSGSTTTYNEYMLKNGYAREYTYNHEPYSAQAEFRADEAEAREHKIGLWGKCAGGV